MRAVTVRVVTHTGEIGGAEAALLRLIDVMDRDRFALSAVVFAEGPLVDAFAARRVPVTVINGAGIERVTRAEAGSVRSTIRNVLGSLRLARRLRRDLVLSPADLTVANSLKAAVMCGIAAPLSRSPWAWHLHDRLAPDYLSWPLLSMLRLLAKWGPRVVVANSQATAATAGRTRSTVVAYPGVPSGWFSSAPRSPRFRRTVGLVGRISATKGQREFLAAIESMGPAVSRARFRIVGAALFEDADEERAVREIALGSHVLRAVEWTGWSADPAREIRRLSLLVHASPVAEPFGQVVVEAMAAGVPVIATDAGGVPEILCPSGRRMNIADGVEIGDFGILVRPRDPLALAAAMTWGITHGSEMRALASAARSSARERFAIERTRDVVERAWIGAASGRRTGKPTAPSSIG